LGFCFLVYRDPGLLHLLRRLPTYFDRPGPESRPPRPPFRHHDRLGRAHARYGLREDLRSDYGFESHNRSFRGWVLPECGLFAVRMLLFILMLGDLYSMKTDELTLITIGLHGTLDVSFDSIDVAS
jgi:hypothetical protein